MNDAPPSSLLVFIEILMFQFRLTLGGPQYVFLNPISIIKASLIGLLSSPTDSSKYFHQLLKVGRGSDRWVNLFNTHMLRKRTLVRYTGPKR